MAQCTSCKRLPFGKETFYQIDGQLNCWECYQKQFSCVGCQNIITAEYVPDGPRKWHTICYNRNKAQPSTNTVRPQQPNPQINPSWPPSQPFHNPTPPPLQSFVCSECRASSTEIFEMEGRHICKRCYENMYTCTWCKQLIRDAFFPIGSGKYHKDCYEKALKSICTTCRVPFGSSKYFELEGHNYCQRCAQAAFSCTKCGQLITQTFTVQDGKKYHPGCLATVLCAGCRTPLHGAILFFNNAQWHQSCLQHHQKSSTINRILERAPTGERRMCAFCKQEIIGEFIMVANQYRHPYCFGPRDSGLHTLH